jgi:hypothetical protein
VDATPRQRWFLALGAALVVAIAIVQVVGKASSPKTPPRQSQHQIALATPATGTTSSSLGSTRTGLGTSSPTATSAATATPVATKAPTAAPTAAPIVAAPRIGPTLAGCPVFPADNIWNRDVSSLPVDTAHSASWIANSGGTSRLLHPDFGSSGTANPYGIPYIVVNSSHPKVSVAFDYSDESDGGPYPFGADTPIEGGAGSGGDQHAIMIDSSTCTLYELYDANYSAGGSTAGSGAIWNLASDALRPAGWTSADAAGLPIFPGLLRPDEVSSGVVRHAIRMTVQTTSTSYVWPARHQAGSTTDPNFAPMGARFRLKAGVDISHYSADTQVVLTAMKHYGMIVADNGSNWYFQGAAEDNWDPVMIQQLKSIPAGDFEAVDTSSLMVNPNSGQSR